MLGFTRAAPGARGRAAVRGVRARALSPAAAVCKLEASREAGTRGRAASLSAAAARVQSRRLKAPPALSLSRSRPRRLKASRPARAGGLKACACLQQVVLPALCPEYAGRYKQLEISDGGQVPPLCLSLPCVPGLFPSIRADRSVLEACRPDGVSPTRTFKHSNIQTFEHSNIQAFKHSNPHHVKPMPPVPTNPDMRKSMIPPSCVYVCVCVCVCVCVMCDVCGGE